MSERERDVLRLVAEGCTNQQIAARLGISVHTVRTYLRRIGEQFGATSRAAMVATALRAGVIE